MLPEEEAETTRSQGRGSERKMGPRTPSFSPTIPQWYPNALADICPSMILVPTSASEPRGLVKNADSWAPSSSSRIRTFRNEKVESAFDANSPGSGYSDVALQLPIIYSDSKHLPGPAVYREAS